MGGFPKTGGGGGGGGGGVPLKGLYKGYIGVI